MEILEAEYGSIFWNKTINLAENCSWQNSGKFLSEIMKNNEFEENDRVFCAAENDEAVGFLTFTMDSFNDIDNLNPWIDFVFVLEDYRGQAISKKMIEKAAIYAKTLGFDKVYLFTKVHSEMYKKYGFKKYERSTDKNIMYKSL